MHNEHYNISNFYNVYQKEILIGKIIATKQIPTSLRQFLNPKKMITDAGDNYSIFTKKGIKLFNKLEEHFKQMES